MTKQLPLLILVAATACGGDADDVTLETALARSCTKTVSPSADDQTTVQAMFVAAKNGDTLCFAAGTYSLTDPLDLRSLDGVTIRGTGANPDAVVLDFSGQTAGAKGINMVSMTNVVVSNLTLLDATGDNLFIESSTNVSIHKVKSGWVTRPIDARGRYALYPVSSTNVLIDQSEAFGSSDAGIYVGQATNCVVRNSLAHDNVTGIEIENSTNCEVFGNTAEHNSGGILVFELPGLPKRGTGTWVHDNIVRDNNIENFAEEGAFVGLVPSGTGIMLLAANEVDIQNNTVTGNHSTGLFVVSYGTVQFIGGPAPMDTAYDPFSEHIYVHGNTFNGNGSSPDASLQVVTELLGISNLEDVVWDGYLKTGQTANTLCVTGTLTFRNVDVPGFLANSSTDVTSHNCTSYGRGAVSLPQDPQ